ncbi:MAG: hypothetical protein ABI351_09540, partial [Herbaspirillum sp.]
MHPINACLTLSKILFDFGGQWRTKEAVFRRCSAIQLDRYHSIFISKILSCLNQNRPSRRHFLCRRRLICCWL